MNLYILLQLYEVDAKVIEDVEIGNLNIMYRSPFIHSKDKK
ncbi:hypothetical protein [Clostridium algidicarnis]|nr:hypothetical protein [Clostridium algidicarnis]